MKTGRRRLLPPESPATNRRRQPHVGSHEALAGARTHRPAPARHGEPRHPPGTKSNASPGRSAYSAAPHRHGPPPRVLRQRPSVRSIPRSARVSVAPRNHRKWGCLTSFINPSKIARSGNSRMTVRIKKGCPRLVGQPRISSRNRSGYPIFPYFIRSSPYRRLPDRFFEGASSRRSRSCGPADGYRQRLVRSGNLPHALGFDSGTARPK